MILRTGAVILAFLAMFSLIGLNNYEPRHPVLRFSSCLLGVYPVLSFGSSRTFSAGQRHRGTVNVPVTGYFVSWPGGIMAVWRTPHCGFEPNPIALAVNR